MRWVHYLAGWSNEECGVSIMKQLLAGGRRVELEVRDREGKTAGDCAREQRNETYPDFR